MYNKKAIFQTEKADTRQLLDIYSVQHCDLGTFNLTIKAVGIICDALCMILHDVLIGIR